MPRTARIFLSYKRNVEPDQSLARDVVASLSEAGHSVFIDQRLTVGQAWAEEIEKQVRKSDYLVVFLTAESSRSEMVRGEIELARHHAATNGSPRILPVRLAFDGPLPYPLNAYLDKIQYAVWAGAADTPRLLRELRDAVGGDQPASIGSLPRARGCGRASCRRRTRRRCPCQEARSTSTTRGICHARPMPRRCR